MKSVPVYVGLDYHQASVQVCVMDRDGNTLVNDSVENDWREIARLVGAKGRQVHAAIEACTGSANLAEELVRHAGWSVDLAHAGYVMRMKGNPDKTDYADARLLADLERVGYLPRVWLAPEKVRELRVLVRHRQELVDERRNTKLRVSALLRQHRQRSSFRPWTLNWLQWLSEVFVPEQSRWVIDRHVSNYFRLKGEIAIVERRLAEVTADNALVARLQSMKAIGPVTSWMIAAEIAWFDRFRNGKQLARFCGLSPRNASSGARQADSGMIRAGNPRLRATLIEAGHRLIRYDDDWKAFAKDLLKKGKPTCVVVAAAANRWIRRLYHEMNSEAMAA
jgi:transposase